MKPGDKMEHPHWGEVTVLEQPQDVMEVGTLVELPDGIHQWVTTEWLTPSNAPAGEH